MDLEIVMINEVRKGQEPYDFTQIWDVKQIAKKVIDTDKNVVDTRGVGAWVKDEEGEWGQYVVTKEDQTLGGGHKMEYTDEVLYICTFETYTKLLTNVIPQNQWKNMTNKLMLNLAPFLTLQSFPFLIFYFYMSNMQS